MSILQEYEQIRKSMSPRKNKAIDQFLETHSQYLLSDVFYDSKVYQIFKNWWDHQELSNINKYINIIDGNILGKDDIKNIYIEICSNPKLQECVIEFAKVNLKENIDKDSLITCIKQNDYNLLTNSSIEFQDKFLVCSKGGMEEMREELKKKHSKSNKKYQSISRSDKNER